MKILFAGLLMAVSLTAHSQPKSALEKEVVLDEVKVKVLPLKTFTQKGRSPLLPILTYQVYIVDPSHSGPVRLAYLDKIEPFSKSVAWISSIETKLEPFESEKFDVFFISMQIVGTDTIVNRKIINAEEMVKDKYTLHFESKELSLLPQSMFLGLEIVPKKVDKPFMYPLYAPNNSENLFLYYQYPNHSKMMKDPLGIGLTFNFKIKYYEQ